MTNDIVEYIYKTDKHFEADKYIFSSDKERQEWIESVKTEYTITAIYEDEDCYCMARSWYECSCGNFK